MFISIEAMELQEAKININAKIVRILPLQYNAAIKRLKIVG